jgi:uncharacterized protein YprB with RNaseH-like and TPR domain/predicted nuclease with RNAse H fold
MLKSDFSHISGLGNKTVQILKENNIFSWDDYLNKSLLLGKIYKQSIANEIKNSLQKLENKNTDYFAERICKADLFKIPLTFPEDTMFLDIETTGLSLYYDSITVIGYSKNGKFNVFINDGEQSAEQFLQDLKTSKALVTYNGTMFDVKFIQKLFPQAQFPKAHLDLRFFCKRHGLTGGQKAIEIETGFTRKKEIKTVLGDAAPILWHQYRRGDKKSLKKLIEYNKADIQGMKYILDHILKKNLNIDFKFYNKKDDILKFGKDGIELPTPNAESLKPLTTYKMLNKRKPLDDFCVIGIDLVSSEERESGMCVLKGNQADTCRLKTDDEMIAYAKKYNADLVSIDSPLSIPEGRTSFFDDDPNRHFGITRLCERILKKRGINSYPCLIPSMQKLTRRGMELTEKFRKEGIDVIESYPGAAQDVMNIPRKQAGLQYLVEGLSEFGVHGEFEEKEISHDELDAITSAIVGHFYKADMYEALGNEIEDYLIIPKI